MIKSKMRKLQKASLSDRGGEVLNPQTLTESGPSRPESLNDKVQKYVRGALYSDSREHETFEEANDFNVDDPFDMDEPFSRYQLAQEEYLPGDEPDLDQNLKPALPAKADSAEGGGAPGDLGEEPPADEPHREAE